MKKIFNNPEIYPLTWRLHSANNPVYINEYLSTNGYKALKKTLKNFSSYDVISKVKKSGLKGRGGAGFPTGLKWDLVFNSLIKDQKYLICNADEMEPGTYKDRFLMENLPHLLIEGIILSAYALEASIGYIFLRGDYYKAEINLNRAIQEAKDYGFLGKNILGTDFNFEVFLHTGAGRYICGEETALINSLEGKRPNPRYKPPFPANFGLWGKPTCVNNVETLSNIPAIILHGSKWYKSISNSLDSGTKLMGFSGKVRKPGLWELPLGTSAKLLLEKYAGGMIPGFELKAWQPGGASTGFISPDNLDVPMDFLSLQKFGSRLGTGLAMAIDSKTDIISLLINIEIFFARESCGFCTPCREGLPWIVNILKELEKNDGHPDDIKLLEELCINLGPGKTFCAHAPGAISPLNSAIKLFRKDFKNRINCKKNFKKIDVLSLS